MRSDGETIFRTRLHRSFWVLLNTKSGILDIRFPDKEQRLPQHHFFHIKPSPGTQWTRKREQRVTVPLPFPAERLADCFDFLEQIHANTVAWYDRGRDSSVTLNTLFGSPGAKRVAPLLLPSQEVFLELLATPRCATCGSDTRLNLICVSGAWRLCCDDHHPTPSAWRHVGANVIPHEVKEHVWHRDAGRCVQCGSTKYLAFDHMIPANRGGTTFSGSNCESNIRLRCRTCNSSKSNRLVL